MAIIILKKHLQNRKCFLEEKRFCVGKCTLTLKLQELQRLQLQPFH